MRTLWSPILLALLFLAPIASELLAASENSTRSSKETLEGFSLGFYFGAERGAANIYPYEPSAGAVGVPKLFLAGALLKYRFRVLMIRAAFEGGLPFGGSGNDDAGVASESYKMTLMHAPASLGMSFPLFDKSTVYILGGYSYFSGVLTVKGDDANNTYSFKVNGVHFIVGTELNVTESSVMSLEWVHTSGISGTLKNDSAAEREVGFVNDQILLGYSYYFKL